MDHRSRRDGATSSVDCVRPHGQRTCDNVVQDGVVQFVHDGALCPSSIIMLV